MRAWGWSLLAAVLPWMGPADSPSMPLRPVAPPCAGAGRKPRGQCRGAPSSGGSSRGRSIRRGRPTASRLLEAGEDRGSPCGCACSSRTCAAGSVLNRPPVVGRILYGDEPGTEIFLSIEVGGIS
jgi:hypothetical protein